MKESSSHNRYRFTIWLGVLFILTNTISRIVLTGMAIQKNNLSPTDLVYAFASGFIYDLATLSYVLITIIISLTIVPLRWRKNRIWISAG